MRKSQLSILEKQEIAALPGLIAGFILTDLGLLYFGVSGLSSSESLPQWVTGLVILFVAQSIVVHRIFRKSKRTKKIVTLDTTMKLNLDLRA